MLAAVPCDKQRWAVIRTSILSPAAIVLTEPIFNAVPHSQQLTAAIITPSDVSTAHLCGWPESLEFANDDEIQTAKIDVLEQMRALGYPESFRVLSITREGKGRKSVVIVVVRAPIAKQVASLIADKSVVVYIQNCEIWEKKLIEVPVLHRSITIEPPGWTFDEIKPDWLATILRRRR